MRFSSGERNVLFSVDAEEKGDNALLGQVGCVFGNTCRTETLAILLNLTLIEERTKIGSL